MDLEIANESLLAVNSSLEDTIREQARKMEAMSKRIAFLTRNVPDFVARSLLKRDGEQVAGEWDDEMGEAVDMEGIAPRKPKEGPSVFDAIDLPAPVPTDDPEAEVAYNRVCAMLTQLIDDGSRALERDRSVVAKAGGSSAPAVDLAAMGLLPLTIPVVQEPCVMSPTSVTPEPQGKPEPKGRLTTRRSASRLGGGASSSPAPQAPAAKKGAALRTTTTTAGGRPGGSASAPSSRRNSVASPPASPLPPSDPRRSDSPVPPSTTKPSTPPTDATTGGAGVPPACPSIDTLLKKARLVVASRRAFHSPTATATQRERELAADDLLLTHPPVQIPAALYGALAELVQGVHCDLMG
ncbi:hypothetical protein HDU96_002053, partial [Phlyctochytrium bullatum]